MSAADKSSAGGPSPRPLSRGGELLGVLATDVDAALDHLARCLQTRSGAETVLLFA
ncbi:hypothetical protein E4U42_003189, partial [Claviceps africana]